MTPFLAQDAGPNPLGPYIIYVQQKATQSLPDEVWLTQPKATIIAGGFAVLAALCAFMAVVFKDRREGQRARRASELNALAEAAGSLSSAVNILRGRVAIAAGQSGSANPSVRVISRQPSDNLREALQACKVANAKLRLMNLRHADDSFKRAISLLENYAVIIARRVNAVEIEQLDCLELDTLDQLKRELNYESRADKRDRKRFLRKVRKSKQFKKFKRGELDLDAELQEAIKAAVAEASGPEPTPSAPNGS